MTARRTAELILARAPTPATLHRRVVDMAGALATLIVREHGPGQLLQRLSDPLWFQAFGCALGADWHSSGLTTTVCTALKEAARKHGRDLGIVVCGGKGATTRKTPEEIRRACERSGDQAEPLIYASRLATKVDSAAVQDGYVLYHHAFIFVPGSGAWCLIQQGMYQSLRHARRYHWNSAQLTSFVSDPHTAIACDRRVPVLNLVAGEGERHRQAVTALTREHPDRVLREIRAVLDGRPLPVADGPASKRKNNGALGLRPQHRVRLRDLNLASLKKVLQKTFESQACDFEELLGDPSVGAEALRSLSMLAELIYQAPASRRDPAAYSFVHGGRDGQPYPNHRKTYDANLEGLRELIRSAKFAQTDQAQALKSLAEFTTKLSRA